MEEVCSTTNRGLASPQVFPAIMAVSCGEEKIDGLVVKDTVFFLLSMCDWKIVVSCGEILCSF
jgi:hypothetical protein